MIFRPFYTFETGCAGCHNGGTAATTVVGKENCWVCHK